MSPDMSVCSARRSALDPECANTATAIIGILVISTVVVDQLLSSLSFPI